MRIVSWNVNGLRAVLGKGFGDFVANANADIICLQEIKGRAEQVDYEWPSEYTVFWNSAAKLGYSGTLTATRQVPLSVSQGVGEAEGDAEGRVQTLEFADFFLVNVYTPNAGNELRRLDFRTRTWDRKFRKYCSGLATRKPVLFCGDLNVAHEEIDLANPKTNRNSAGFTDEERSEFSGHLKAGFIDSFRHLYPGEPDRYSWWSYRAGARSRNIGWRIDYVCLSAALEPQLRDAFIWPQVMGSDHCPVGVDLDL